MRVLGRIRLSRSTEESTSVDRQRELIQRWADDNGHTVVAWAEDVDVSGTISPFDAPALAPYLSDKAGEWDIIVAWKLDRLARRSVELHKLFGWIQDHNKQLVCITDNIDLSTWAGRMVASVIAGVAEAELEAIRERTTASHQKLREVGRWAGGKIPYGWRKYKLDDGGWALEHDPVTMPIVQRMISDFLGGKSVATITKELEEDGIPTPGNYHKGLPGGKWTEVTVYAKLKAVHLIGWTSHKGQTLLDKEGKPVIKCPPAIDVSTFNEIQQRFEAGAMEKYIPKKTSPLLGVLRCWECDNNLHFHIRPDKSRSYYWCRDHKDNHRINGENVLPLVYDTFLDELGDYPVTQKKVTPANDLSLEISETSKTYDDLVAYIPNARTDEARTKLFAQLDLIEQRLQQLRSESTTADTVEWIESGQTYRDLWETLDTQERRLLMVKAGFIVRIRQITKGTRTSKGIFETEFVVPEDLKERLGIQS